MTSSYEVLRLPAAALLDNIRSMYNVGAFFRSADGVGLEKLCLCGITARPPKSAIAKTALGAEKNVAWEHDWDAVHMAEALRRSGYEIAAIETSARSVDLFEWRPRFPVCVAFGNEVEGLASGAAGVCRHACPHPHAGPEEVAERSHRRRDCAVRAAKKVPRATFPPLIKTENRELRTGERTEHEVLGTRYWVLGTAFSLSRR